MYGFIYYEALTGLLSRFGLRNPITVNRSTVHRWRVAGAVPADPFHLLYYYTKALVLDVDVDGVLSDVGFSDFSSLPHAL